MDLEGHDIGAKPAALAAQQHHASSLQIERRRRRDFDCIDYHKATSIGLPEKIRIPTSLLSKWLKIKNHLKSHNAAVLDWLFQKCQPLIESLPETPSTISSDRIAIARAPRPVSRPDGVVVETLSDLDDDPEVQSSGQVPVGNLQSTDSDSSEDLDDEGVDNFLQQAESIEAPQSIQHRQPEAADSSKYAFLAKSKLQDLFAYFKVLCPQPGCNFICDTPSIHNFLMCYTVSFKCTVGHKSLWISGELEAMRHLPEIVPKLYNAILCVGLSCTHLREICTVVGIHEPSESHFYDFQRGWNRKIGWIDVVTALWDKRKGEVQADMALRPGGIVVYLDAQFDSSRSGYHGTGPILEKETGLVIEMVTRTREECGNSWRIEDQVIKEGLELLRGKGVQILEAVHDDKSSIDTLLSDFGILYQKDLWHKAKKLTKKFTEALIAAKRSAPSCITENSTTDEILQMTNAKLSEFCKANKLRHTDRKDQLLERILTFLGMEYDPNERPNTSGSIDLVAYPEFGSHDLAYKVKSRFYTCCIQAAKKEDETLDLSVKDLKNIALHWAGDHTICAELEPNKTCVKTHWRPNCRYIAKESDSYKALEEWLCKNITMAKMRFYIKARENYLFETFHSLINKYATKRIHWRKLHEAWLACTALDWNENQRQRSHQSSDQEGFFIYCSTSPKPTKNSKYKNY